MASIDKIPTGWRARWRTPEGAQRSRTYARKIDAERYLAGIEVSKLDGSFTDPLLGRRTFGEWWDSWRSTRVDLRPSTVARDESYARNHVLPKLGDTPLARIDRTTLRTWVAELCATGLAPATVAKIVQLARAALGAAVDERLIARNPAEGLDLPRIETDEMRFLTPDEIATLSETIDRRYRTWVLTAAYSGLRFGELAGLRPGRVDLLRRRLEVAEILIEVRGKHHFGAPKTKAGRRAVPIPGPIADELTDHIAGMRQDELVFTAPQGGPLRASQFRRRVWYPAVAAAGLAPLRPHDLRHTAVSLWIAGGAGPKEIATWAGHASVATVLDRYGHLQPGQEDRAMSALETLFTAARSTPNATVVTLSR